jgi:hypothetical protein
MGIDTISTPKDEALFVTAEAVFGTLEYPVAADVVPLITDATFTQPKTLISDPQKKMTISEQPKLALGFEPGQFSFTMFVKPSGALGTPPKGSEIIAAGFGKAATVVGSTSVTYTLGGINDDVMGLSFVHRYGHMVTWMSGCIVDKLVFPVKADESQDALGQVQVSGTFCKQVMAGYAYAKHATEFPIAATDIVVESAGAVLDARQFEVGCQVQFRNPTTGAVVDNNSGAGFTVSTVTLATGTITLSTGLLVAVPNGSIVDGFIPTASDGGSTVFGRLGSAQECLAGGSLADILIFDSSIEITNNFKLKSNEKTSSLYPITASRAGNRQVAYTCNKVFRKGEGSSYYAESKAQTQKHVSVPVGDVAAYRYTFDMPLVVYNDPVLSSGDELGIGLTGAAVASAAFDDELTMTMV